MNQRRTTRAASTFTDDAHPALGDLGHEGEADRPALSPPRSALATPRCDEG